MNEQNYELQMQQRYDDLAEATGEILALFYCCIAFDVPYVRDLVPERGTKNRWTAYMDALEKSGMGTEESGEPLGFLDGLTDITKAFGNDSKAEFRKKAEAEIAEIEKAAGTVRQRQLWGNGDEKKPYTKADYNRLDEIFKTYSARLVSAGGMDVQQEYILRMCSRMSLQMEKALTAGHVDVAQKLNKMIQDNLASENLRKKDEKPIEELRIDSIVDALEKAGMVKEGKILSLPELQKVLLERLGALGGKPSHKYPYTLDAADQMIHIIINTMRTNDGLPETTEFPDNTLFDENVAPEFADEPNKDELTAYEGMELIRLDRFEKNPLNGRKRKGR